MTHIAKIDLFTPAWTTWHFRALREVGRPAVRRAAVLGGLGLVSALVSNFYAGGSDTTYPFLPGVYFGLVLVAGVGAWGTRKPLQLLAVFAATNIAWWAAYEASLQLYDTVEQLSSVPSAICGLLSGLIGSAIATAAVALASKGFGTRETWSRTLVIGTLSGVLLQHIEGVDGSLLPLLLVWQTGVAASIGYGLGARAAGR
jgi:hypothetical protein